MESFLNKLGGAFQNGRGNAPCPVCQQERRLDQNALSIRVSDGRLLVYCFKGGCSFADIASAINLPRVAFEGDLDVQRNAIEKRTKYQATTKSNARRSWDAARFIGGTKAEAYLRGRGITITLPDSLRFLPDIYHTPSGQFLCAMVADVQPSGGIHRTFFTKQGQRIQKNAKMMLGPCSGGAVRLSEGDGPLVAAEGIETALSLVELLSEQSPTVWAALSTSGMKGLQLPKEPHSLIIAPDGDDAGRKASQVLAQRASMLGWDVSLLVAPEGADWNDVLMDGAK